jgi:copper(I)-binding protein
MVMDRKTPIDDGGIVDLTLVPEDRNGKKEAVAIKAPVNALGTPAVAQRH